MQEIVITCIATFYQKIISYLAPKMNSLDTTRNKKPYTLRKTVFRTSPEQNPKTPYIEHSSFLITTSTLFCKPIWTLKRFCLQKCCWLLLPEWFPPQVDGVQLCVAYHLQPCDSGETFIHMYVHMQDKWTICQVFSNHVLCLKGIIENSLWLCL
jgi:hypothetical protein